MPDMPTKGGTRPAKGGKGSGKGKAARAPLPGTVKVASAASAGAGSATGKGSIASGGTRTRGSKGNNSNRTGTTKKGKKSAQGEDGKKKKKRRINRAKREPWRRWARYIHKLQHNDKDHPKLSMSARSMKIVGAFCEDMFERIVTSASQIAKFNHTATVTAKEIQTACRLMLPHDFAQHSISEGTRAVTRYNQALELRATQE